MACCISFGQTLKVTTAVRTAVTEAIKAAKTIPVLVNQLNQKSATLSAASALVRLVKIGRSLLRTATRMVRLSVRSDDVAVMVSDDESGACAAIVNMLQNRWFDGLRGEDGLQVLSELLECGQFHTMVWLGILLTNFLGSQNVCDLQS